MRQTAELKHNLYTSSSSETTCWSDREEESAVISCLNAAAQTFIPFSFSGEIDGQARLFEGDELGGAGQSSPARFSIGTTGSCQRRDLREPLAADHIPREMHVQEQLVVLQIDSHVLLAEVLARACLSTAQSVKAVVQRVEASLEVHQLEMNSVQGSENVLAEDGPDSHLQCNDFLDELRVLVTAAQKVLAHLEQAAALACKAEMHREDDGLDAFFNQFLEDYCCLLDPAGVAKRREENRLVEEEFKDLSAYIAGHLSPYSRSQFWSIMHCVPKGVEDALSIMGEQVQERVAATSIKIADVERLYHTQDSCWQDEYSDEEELLTVRRVIRRAFDMSVVDWD